MLLTFTLMLMLMLIFMLMLMLMVMIMFMLMLMMSRIFVTSASTSTMLTPIFITHIYSWLMERTAAATSSTGYADTYSHFWWTFDCFFFFFFNKLQSSFWNAHWHRLRCEVTFLLWFCRLDKFGYQVAYI